MKPPGDGSTTNAVPHPEETVANSRKVEFRLMQLGTNSALALPKSAYWPSSQLSNQLYEHIDVPWHFTPDAMAFAKFMISTPEYMTGELQRDMDEIDVSMAEARSWAEEAEIPFLEMAITRVKEEIETTLNDGVLHAVGEREEKAREEIKKATSISEKKKPRKEAITVEEAPEFYEHVRGVAAELGSINALGTTPPGNTSKGDNQLSANDDASYFFYQFHDGQHIYLHPLDIRILKHEFGSYADFPLTLTAPIVAISESTLTADLRKRFKYLSHLPLSCDVTFVELELSGIVSEETTLTFSNELKSRMTKRREKFKKEEKARREAEERETTGMEKARLTRLDRELMLRKDPFFQVPSSFGADDTTILDVEFDVESDGHDQRLSEDSAVNTDENSHNFPVAHPTPPAQSSKKTVWGTPAVSFANVAANKQKPGDKDGKWAAFDEDDLEDDGYNDWGETREIVNKKGKKKLVLMSTGGRRGV